MPAQAQGAADGAAAPASSLKPRPAQGRDTVAPSVQVPDALAPPQGARSHGDQVPGLQQGCPYRGGKLELIV